MVGHAKKLVRRWLVIRLFKCLGFRVLRLCPNHPSTMDILNQLQLDVVDGLCYHKLQQRGVPIRNSPKHIELGVVSKPKVFFTTTMQKNYNKLA